MTYKKRCQVCGRLRPMTKLLGGMPATEVDIETQKYWNTYNKEKIEKAVKQYEQIRK